MYCFRYCLIKWTLVPLHVLFQVHFIQILPGNIDNNGREWRNWVAIKHYLSPCVGFNVIDLAHRVWFFFFLKWMPPHQEDVSFLQYHTGHTAAVIGHPAHHCPLVVRTIILLTALKMYSALLISCGHFSQNNSWKTPIARPWGRGMGVFREFKIWSKSCLQSCCASNTMLYCTAMYRGSIIHMMKSLLTSYTHQSI